MVEIYNGGGGEWALIVTDQKDPEQVSNLEVNWQDNEQCCPPTHRHTHTHFTCNLR